MAFDFSTLTPREELVLRLDAFTDRALLGGSPPHPDETMAQLGISKTNLDAFIRIYVNKRFGKGVRLYDKGKLTPDITFKALCDKCGV